MYIIGEVVLFIAYWIMVFSIGKFAKIDVRLILIPILLAVIFGLWDGALYFHVDVRQVFSVA